MIELKAIDTTPWYKQFWPWFLIGLQGLAIIGCLIMVDISITNADSPVQDNYSKHGLAVDRNTSADELAINQHIRAAFSIDNDHRVTVSLQGDLRDWPTLLTLHCIHPYDAHRDITIALIRAGDSYSGALPDAARGKWKIELRDPMATWRLGGEFDLQPQANFNLPL